jgi:methyl-accepting chemotaxis protein
MKILSVVNRLYFLVAIPVIAIVFLVFSSLNSFSNINAGVGRIYDERLVPLVYLKGVTDGYTKIVNSLNKADNGLLDPNIALAEINNARQEITGSWSKYLEGNHVSEEQETIALMDGLFGEADKLIDEVVGILNSLGRDMEYDEDGETVITDYNGDLFEYVDPIFEQVLILINIQTVIAQEERSAAQSIYDKSFSVYIVLSILILVGMSTSGILVGLSISRPLKIISDTMDNTVASCDLTIKLPSLA